MSTPITQAPGPGLLTDFSNPIKAALQEIEHLLGQALASLISATVTALTSETQVSFGQRYVHLYDIGLYFALFVAAAAVLFGAGAAALSGDMTRLTRSISRVVVGILASFALLTLVLMVQHAISRVDVAILNTLQGSDGQAGAAALVAILAGLISTGPGLGLALLMGGALLLGMLILFGVLALASALAYLSCFFAPFAFVASAKAGRKILELIAAMLLTPFVISGTLAVGFAIIGDPPSGGAPSTHLAAEIVHGLMGIGLICVALTAPLAILRMMPVTESSIANLRHPHQVISNVQSKLSGGSRDFGPKSSPQPPPQPPSQTPPEPSPDHEAQTPPAHPPTPSGASGMRQAATGAATPASPSHTPPPQPQQPPTRTT